MEEHANTAAVHPVLMTATMLIIASLILVFAVTVAILDFMAITVKMSVATNA